MSFDFNNKMPIYLQIIDDIKINIITNIFPPNSKLPSVRELSFEYGANPNTIQKSLTELENIGLIYTERTNGKFVTNDTNLIKKIKQEIISEKIQNFYTHMKTLGVGKQELLEIINNSEVDK